jgi:hypothetical protein
MRKFLLIPLLLLSLTAGCATTPITPQQTVTNTLLATHDTIVNIETGIRQPCATGIIPATTCASITAYLQQAKPAYNAAVDAQTVWLTSGTATTQADFTAKKQALDSLIGDALGLAVKYGVTGGVK